VNDHIGANLQLVIAAWTDLFARGSIDALADLLAPDVVWNGAFPDEICHNRDEVLDILVRSRTRVPRITRLEAEEKGDQVAISVQGPDFQGDGRRLVGPPSIMFTFRNRHVIRMKSLKSRDEAFRMVSGSA
jgi:hypothetical protein